MLAAECAIRAIEETKWPSVVLDCCGKLEEDCRCQEVVVPDSCRKCWELVTDCECDDLDDVDAATAQQDGETSTEHASRIYGDWR